MKILCCLTLKFVFGDLLKVVQFLSVVSHWTLMVLIIFELETINWISTEKKTCAQSFVNALFTLFILEMENLYSFNFNWFVL